MVRATDISSTNRTQDQMTDFISTDTEENGIEFMLIFLDIEFSFDRST